jgi:hypothetical protein
MIGRRFSLCHVRCLFLQLLEVSVLPNYHVLQEFLDLFDDDFVLQRVSYTLVPQKCVRLK